ncbi:MAG TPA: hypothetical protein VFE26_13680, partial [Trebonia sp.]|nr:hypothetical protein [Trebonia sp.]
FFTQTCNSAGGGGMRSGRWRRRLSRWRTRKSLPTDGAAFRAASATARDVSRAFVLASAPWRRDCRADPCQRQRGEWAAATINGRFLRWRILKNGT